MLTEEELEMAERYVNDELTADEKTSLEKRMQTDPEFQVAFMDTVQLVSDLYYSGELDDLLKEEDLQAEVQEKAPASRQMETSTVPSDRDKSPHHSRTMEFKKSRSKRVPRYNRLVLLLFLLIIVAGIMLVLSNAFESGWLGL